MEARKYSTGTKGRIKMHNDKCREFVQANAPSFSLANEFIASILEQAKAQLSVTF